MANEVEENSQYLLDINWYFRDFWNRFCVVASAGGKLPDYILQNSESNDEFHSIVMDLPEVYESVRNEEALNHLKGINFQAIEFYFSDFESLAKRGFYVFDRLNISNPEDDEYLLVAYPEYGSIDMEYPPKVINNFKSQIPRTSQLITRKYGRLSNSNFKPKKLLTFINSKILPLTSSK